MAYSKNNLEVHSLIAGLYDQYRERGFIHFRNAPEIKGTQYLEPMIEAIEGKQVLRITYLPFYEDKPYFNEVHPYLLKEHGFRWYLVGWNEFKGQVRTYALDRIREVQELEGHSYREPEFSAATYFKYALGIISPPGAPPLIKLAVQKTRAQYLITQPWHDSQNIHAEDDEREETMSEEPLMPSEVRRKVLSQHREIEQMLSELEAGVAHLGDGKVDAEQVKRAAYALRGILELHMNFEEAHMAPAINDADGFGPERVRHLNAEHAEQRRELDRLVDQIREASSPVDLTASVVKLAEMLRKDIEEEEREYVNEKLLHDHIMPSDTFGG